MHGLVASLAASSGAVRYATAEMCGLHIIRKKKRLHGFLSIIHHRNFRPVLPRSSHGVEKNTATTGPTAYLISLLVTVAVRNVDARSRSTGARMYERAKCRRHGSKDP